MTTIILTIIGILLAAAAALMVIFYGGDAFNSGSTGAAATQVTNSAVNIVSSVELYRADKGARPTSMADLTTDAKYLKDVPTLAGVGTQRVQPFDGRTLYVVDGVPADICARINRDLKIPQSVIVTIFQTPGLAAPKPHMACYQSTVSAEGQFYSWF